MDEFVADSDEGERVLEERLSAWFGNHFASFDARSHGRIGPH